MYKFIFGAMPMKKSAPGSIGVRFASVAISYRKKIGRISRPSPFDPLSMGKFTLQSKLDSVAYKLGIRYNYQAIDN